MVGGAVTLLLGGMAVSSWMERGASGLRERLQRFVAEVDAQELAVDHHHDAVWGETHEGSAFAHYDTAARLQRLCSNFCWNDARGIAMVDNQELLGEEFAARRAQWRPVVEAVAAGAHARDRSPLGVNLSMPLAWGLRAETCARLAGGESLAAVQLWLDVLTMHADLDPTGFFGWGMAGHWISVWDDARLTGLSPDACALLDAGVGRLEARVDVTSSPTGAIAASLRPLLDGTSAGRGWSLRERLWAWKSGMNPERRHLEGLAELVSAAPLLLPAATSFAAREEQWRKFVAMPRPNGTYGSSHVDERLRNGEKVRRGVLTRLRLLRLAIAFHAGAQLPELADPFADAPLRVTGDDERVLLRSAGGIERYVHRVR